MMNQGENSQKTPLAIIRIFYKCSLLKRLCLNSRGFNHMEEGQQNRSTGSMRSCCHNTKLTMHSYKQWGVLRRNKKPAVVTATTTDIVEPRENTGCFELNETQSRRQMREGGTALSKRRPPDGVSNTSVIVCRERRMAPQGVFFIFVY